MAVVPGIVRFVGSRSIRYALIDTASVSGFDVDVRDGGKQLLTTLKCLNVVNTVAIAHSGPIRTFGSAIGLAAGMSLRIYSTRPEAMNALDALRARKIAAIA